MARAIHASFYQIWQVMCITVPCWCTHSVLRVNLKHDWILLYNTVCAQAITSNREMVEWLNRNRGFRRCIFMCIWNKYWIPTIYIKYNKNCSYYMYFDMHKIIIFLRERDLVSLKFPEGFRLPGSILLCAYYTYFYYMYFQIFSMHTYTKIFWFFLDGSIKADFIQILEHIRGKYACFLF